MVPMKRPEGGDSFRSLGRVEETKEAGPGTQSLATAQSH